jgi:putative transcriptional regulator
MNEHVTNNIRELRSQNNKMTQQALAEITGVSRQTIISIESHRYTPSLLLALKIAESFNLKVGDIFTIAEQ